MAWRLRLRAALALGLLLATAAAEAHQSARPATPPEVAVGAPDRPLPSPVADRSETGALASEPSPAESDPGAWAAGAPPISSTPVVVLVLGTAVGLAAGCRRPRAVAVVLGVALSAFAVQSAIHSVHHIGHPHEAEKCPVLLASQHTPGDVPTAESIDGPAENMADAVLATVGSFTPDPALRPDQGRAPPSLPV